MFPNNSVTMDLYIVVLCRNRFLYFLLVCDNYVIVNDCYNCKNRIRTRPSETEEKGVNYSFLHICLTSADISSDSLSLLYTGLPLKTIRTVLSNMQNMDDQTLNLKLNLLFRIFANNMEYESFIHSPF